MSSFEELAEYITNLETENADLQLQLAQANDYIEQNTQQYQ